MVNGLERKREKEFRGFMYLKDILAFGLS